MNNYVHLVFRVPQESLNSPIKFDQIFSLLLEVVNESSLVFLISMLNEKISYSVLVELRYEKFVSTIFYSHFSEIEMFKGNSVVLPCRSAYMRLANPFLFPIKRYEQFEDKLNREYVDSSQVFMNFMKLYKDSVLTIKLDSVSSKLRMRAMKSISAASEIQFRGDKFRNLILYKNYVFPSFRKRINFEDETRIQHTRETSLEAAVDKVNKPLLRATIKLYASCDQQLSDLAACFTQFSVPNSNRFSTSISKASCILNTEELATLYHFPVKSDSHVLTVKSLKLSSDFNSNDLIVGVSNFRNSRDSVGVSSESRSKHFYIVGKTGSGKSTLLYNMICSDMKSGRGVGLIDPHGDLADRVLSSVPKNRLNELVYLNPADFDYPFGLNLLEGEGSIVASGVIGVFKKMFGYSWGPRLEYVLRNTILSLLNYSEKTTLLCLPKMLTDKNYRKVVVDCLSDVVLKKFWFDEYENMSEKMRLEVISPILNKVGQFLSVPVLRNIVSQVKSTVDFSTCMNKGQIVIVDLSKGKLGEDVSGLLGGMIITKFQIAAMSRFNNRDPFYFYVDEFQNFATDSFGVIFAEARKYGLNLIIANQSLMQIDEDLRSVVLGNVGNLFSFRVGAQDAEVLMREFGDPLTDSDFINLCDYEGYFKIGSDKCSVKTQNLAFNKSSSVNKLRRLSRERFCVHRTIVESKVLRFSK